ncbi:MAG: hypothetical protein HY084_12035 [Gemmatimonadetes bacterium]|nr:hypothetical protein [Gemmatimonadota bacterium]
MIPSQQHVQKLLDEFHPTIAEAGRAAFERWLKIPPVERVALHHARTYANVIWALFRDEAIARLGAHPNIRLTHRHNTLGIIAHDRLMLRFKRVNRRGKSRNFPTLTNLAFYSQLEIPGIPASCPRAEIGWREDALRLGLEALEIVMRDGATLAWRYSILDQGGASVTPLIAPNPTPRQGSEHKSQVRGRRRKRDDSQEA